MNMTYKAHKNVKQCFIGRLMLLSIASIFILVTAFIEYGWSDAMISKKDPGVVNLHEPNIDSKMSVEAALFRRRSVRAYSGKSLTFTDISQLLWASQGITDPKGFRTAPSAGALYPLEVYLIAGNVDDLGAGVYRYIPFGHKMIQILEGDKRVSLYNAALKQSPIKQAPAVIVFCAVYERVTGKYGERGKQYVHMEAGHAAQNVLLQCISLGLNSVVIGAFRDKDVKDVVGSIKNEQPLYIIPIGN